MKHITFADKNFLVGDSTADAVMDYAAMLGQGRTADTIELNAIGADGDEVRATLFLSAGVPLISESTTSTLPEPDNTAAVMYIESRLALRVSPTPFEPDPFFEENEMRGYDDGFGTLD
ncbi:hypothetical protein [Frigoribacterium sp. Leaf172]|uniref:hypothetical protein n=1 Tax=Frigoribacterium sp. Leaf172 TaxID=1736285 RepID=UPI0006F7B283|nr:hypothetical protein [Frigoribacterium sp. Leaf172]KQR64585.1 hypothetical protein ASF89_08865 [Frigoribacterium sp. Leaf172]